VSVAIIIGAAGLFGPEASRIFASEGMDIVGIDNDMRAYFFGASASNASNRGSLLGLKRYHHRNLGMRNSEGLDLFFHEFGTAIDLVIHTAAQPSHDWAAQEPNTDFTINANGTLNLLEMTRKHSPEAVFMFTSTNKVCGDTPNRLPLVEQDTRWELSPGHPYAEGIPETMSIDQSLHSLFGVLKVAADVMVQEYGRYFGMKTAYFRGGEPYRTPSSWGPITWFSGIFDEMRCDGDALYDYRVQGKASA
jgi:CDP-paratose 2-epimerase